MKTIRLFFTLALVILVSASCKTKQKVAEIPAGANVVATTPIESTTPNTPSTPTYTEPEVTRNENFNLADGETNADALKYKYHVVVGSFSKQMNAKGLQSTLNSEGNRAIVVVNENNMFRVLIASFDEYSQARSRINQIKDRFPDAWVLVKK
ncbi:MAG: SPOR domain-containing protein [Paludibacter sp.]|nr:SPOR domain-containing protein [Paludibacter sp.]